MEDGNLLVCNIGFFDNGRTLAAITGTVEADIKPKNTYTELRDRMCIQIGLITSKRQMNM